MPRPSRRTRPRSWTWTLLAALLGLGLGLTTLWFGVVRPARARRDEETRRALDVAREAPQQGRPQFALNVVASLPKTGTAAAETRALEGLAHASLQIADQARALLERSIALAPPGEPMVLKVLAALYFYDDDM